MPRFSPRAELCLIAAAFLALSFGVFMCGRAVDEPLVSFAGLMILASTFVPMPADAYVVQSAEMLNPLTIAVAGGVINALAVLGERLFILRLIDFPIFERIKAFIGTNRHLSLLDKHMFFGLAFAAASPVPFEVFRFVAVTRDVNLFTYFFATFFGRGSRFYVLAVAGGWFASEGILQVVVAIFFLLFFVGLARSVLKVRGNTIEVETNESGQPEDESHGTVD